MIAAQTSCPSDDRLIEILSGNVLYEELESSLSHIDQCVECQARMERIEVGGAILRNANIVSDRSQKPFVWDAFQAESACQAGLSRLLETSRNEQKPSVVLPFDRVGPYRLIRPLGFGGMGTVYLGKHDRLQKEVAIKLLPRERIETPGWLDRFNREMVTIASIENPHVVRATDAGFHDGWHYYVMEHLDGLDIGRIASRLGVLKIADACEIIRQAAIGLACIHERGLVHRDIKPSNLMLTVSGQVKLLDLGLVLAGDDPLAIDERLTTVGHLLGTIGYMAPEQLTDSRSVDWRGDLYSLGATLYRLLTGTLPHPRQHGIASHIMAITSEPPIPIEKLRVGVDSALVDLIRRLLSRDPSVRPSSASEVVECLSEHAKGAQLTSLIRTALDRPDNLGEANHIALMNSLVNVPATKATRKRNRGRWLVGLGVLSALVVAGILLKLETDRGELVIHSEQDGLTILVKQEEKIVERLEVSAGKDQSTLLRKGTYRVEIAGGGTALQLSDNVVTIGRGTQSVVSVEPKTQLRKESNRTEDASGDQSPLYQGQTLAYWRKRLQVEQSVVDLGQAMAAVATLSQDTEHRAECAREILQLGRRWGGLISHGTGEQFGANRFSVSEDPSFESGRFMGYLLLLFPKFLPSPGLEALRDELRSGNEKSRIACAWLLKNALMGVVGEVELAEQRVLVQNWLFDRSHSDRVELARELLSLMPELVASQSDHGWHGLAFLSSLLLSGSIGEPIASQPWLHDQIVSAIEQASESFAAIENLESPQGDIYIYRHVVLAGLELALLNPSADSGRKLDLGRVLESPLGTEDRTLLDYFLWEIIERCDFENNPIYTCQFDKLTPALLDNYSDPLFKGMETRMERMNQKASEPAETTATTSPAWYGGGMMGGVNIPPVVLHLRQIARTDTSWGRLLPEYAVRTPEVAKAIELLASLQSHILEWRDTRAWASLDTQSKFKGEQTNVDLALETLRKRLAEQR